MSPVNRARVGLLALAAACPACVTGRAVPAWFGQGGSAPERYLADGEGETLAAAVADARASLCEQIGVDVSAETDSSRVVRLRRTLDGSGEAERATEVLATLRRTVRSRARCRFNGLALAPERREHVGGRTFVRLALDVDRYARHLDGLTAAVAVVGVADPEQQAHLGAAVVRLLDRLGYVAVQPPAGAALRAELRVAVDVRDTGSEGLLAGTAAASVLVVRADDGRVEHSVSAPALRSPGFSREVVTGRLAEEVARWLDQEATK